MRLISDTAQLAGKTIDNVFVLECGEHLGITFTDQSYVVIESESYGCSSHDLVLSDHVEDYNKREMSVITESEYTDIEYADIKVADTIKAKSDLEALERKQYEKLKIKFENLAEFTSEHK